MGINMDKNSIPSSSIDTHIDPKNDTTKMVLYWYSAAVSRVCSPPWISVTRALRCT